LRSLKEKLSHGVTGNTSVFGTEESRFEPWWDNYKEMKPFVIHKIARGFFVIILMFSYHLGSLGYKKRENLTILPLPFQIIKKSRLFKFNIKSLSIRTVNNCKSFSVFWNLSKFYPTLPFFAWSNCFI
jgi:hypothetical protein